MTRDSTCFIEALNFQPRLREVKRVVPLSLSLAVSIVRSFVLSFFLPFFMCFFLY